MKSPVSDTPMEVLLNDVPFYFDQDQASGALWVLLEPNPSFRSIYLSMLGCSGDVPADGEWHRLDPPTARMEPLQHPFVSFDMVTAPEFLKALGLEPCGDPACPLHGDPDYDVTGPLDAIDADITAEQMLLAEERAIRQTTAWRNPQAKPDPTSILDDPDGDECGRCYE